MKWQNKIVQEIAQNVANVFSFYRRVWALKLALQELSPRFHGGKNVYLFGPRGGLLTHP